MKGTESYADQSRCRLIPGCHLASSGETSPSTHAPPAQEGAPSRLWIQDRRVTFNQCLCDKSNGIVSCDASSRESKMLQDKTPAAKAVSLFLALVIVTCNLQQGCLAFWLTDSTLFARSEPPIVSAKQELASNEKLESAGPWVRLDNNTGANPPPSSSNQVSSTHDILIVVDMQRLACDHFTVR